MRHLGTTTGALLAIASLTLAGCSASAHATTTPTRVTTAPPKAKPTPTSHPVTTTTQVNKVAADDLTQIELLAAMNAAKSIYDQSDNFTQVTPASLAPLAPTIHFAPLGQASKTVVGLLAQDLNDVLFVTRSKSGRWYCITDNNEDGISYGAAPAFSDLDSNGECQQPAWPAPGTSTANPF